MITLFTTDDFFFKFADFILHNAVEIVVQSTENSISVTVRQVLDKRVKNPNFWKLVIQVLDRS